MKFENFDKNLFASKINESVSKLSNLGSVLMDEDVKDEEVSASKVPQLIEQVLNLPFGDDKELALKKMFTTAIVIAKEKGVLPFQIDADPQQIAMLVDDGLTRLKVAYQKGIGMIDAVEAADKLIDLAAVRAVAMADRVIEHGVAIALDRLSVVMAMHPYTAAIAPFVKMATPLLTVQAQKFVRIGITSMVNTAKAAVKKIMPAIASLTTKISKKLFA